MQYTWTRFVRRLKKGYGVRILISPDIQCEIVDRRKNQESIELMLTATQRMVAANKMYWTLKRVMTSHLVDGNDEIFAQVRAAIRVAEGKL